MKHSLLVLCCAALRAANLSSSWETWSPRPELKPVMLQREENGAPLLTITARKFSDYGKWTTTVNGITPGKAYRFSVLYRPTGIESEGTSVVAILSWLGTAAKAPMQRDYADAGRGEGDWRSLERTLEAPKGASSLQVELALRWSNAGSVTWKNAEVAEVPRPVGRKVRIVTTHLRPVPPHTVASNVKQMADLIDRAAERRPDLIVLSENVVDRGVPGSLKENSQTVPGPATQMLAEKARKYKTWISTTLHEIENGEIYNTGVLIDREGAIAGKYRKVHLAMEEGERGITPGSEYPVFDTDFGKVGILTCWDNWFVETARILRMKGAELLILPIAGDGVPNHWDVTSRARAMDNGVFLVSSNTVGETPSRIISPDGNVLAETAEQAGLASAEIDMDAVTRVPWLSVGPGLGDPRSLYQKERRPETYTSLTAATRPVASTDFEGGSGNLRRLSDTHFVCEIRGEADENRRNHQPSWFYFRLDNVRGRETTVDLTGFRGEYNYKPTDGLWAKNLRPAISFDDRNWSFVNDVEFDAAAVRLRMKLRPESDHVWLARIPPYVNAHFTALLGEVGRHPHLQQEAVAETPEGRPMTLLTITNPGVPLAKKKVIWLMTRQHSWEAGTSWVGEGAIRFLLSDDQEAVELRNRFVFRVFPMCDPDGVARGGVRFNAKGYDLNRNWDTADPDRTPEIHAQKKAMLDWLDNGNRIDLFLTIHNTESQDYIDGPVTAGGPRAAEVIRKLQAELVAKTSFNPVGGPRDMRQTTTEGMNGRMTVNQNLFAERKVTALLMELMTETNPKAGRPLSVADRLRFGGELVKAMAVALN